MRSPLLPLLALPLGCGLVAAFALVSACTSGTVRPEQDGFLPDGGFAYAEGAAPSFACAFEVQQTYSCNNLPLAPSGWVTKCIDGDDCKTRVNGSDTVSGCSRTTAYQNVQPLSTSCATWQGSGGTLPPIDSGPAPACDAGAPSGPAPAWVPPRAKTTACTKAQIDAFRQCLDDSATQLNPLSCSEWAVNVSATDQACLTCLLSSSSDAKWGPIVQLPSETLINVAGCLAMAEGKTDGSGCGGALELDQQCTRAACLPTCPTSTPSQIATEDSCEQQANKTTCATFEKPAECAGAIEVGDAGTTAEQACFGGPDAGADTLFEAVALAFCGP